MSRGEISYVRGTLGTGENEWHTPPEYITRARQALGGRIDLDPASSAEAQRIVCADRFFTIEHDGLAHPWNGAVWLNPPYAQPAIGHFVTKLIKEFRAGCTTAAIMLTHNHTDTAWFHEAAASCTLICFTRGRIKFVRGNEVAAPTQGQAFFYFGPNAALFTTVFSEIGFVR